MIGVGNIMVMHGVHYGPLHDNYDNSCLFPFDSF